MKEWVFVFFGPGSQPQFLLKVPAPNLYLTALALCLYLLAPVTIYVCLFFVLQLTFFIVSVYLY